MADYLLGHYAGKYRKLTKKWMRCVERLSRGVNVLVRTVRQWSLSPQLRMTHAKNSLKERVICLRNGQ